MSRRDKTIFAAGHNAFFLRCEGWLTFDASPQICTLHRLRVNYFCKAWPMLSTSMLVKCYFTRGTWLIPWRQRPAGTPRYVLNRGQIVQFHAWGHCRCLSWMRRPVYPHPCSVIVCRRRCMSRPPIVLLHHVDLERLARMRHPIILYTSLSSHCGVRVPNG